MLCVMLKCEELRHILEAGVGHRIGSCVVCCRVGQRFAWIQRLERMDSRTEREGQHKRRGQCVRIFIRTHARTHFFLFIISYYINDLVLLGKLKQESSRTDRHSLESAQGFADAGESAA